MRIAIVFLIILFSISIASVFYQWETIYDDYDYVLHFSGGFFVAMFFISYFKDHLPNSFSFKNMFIIVGAVTLVGVLWEFSEYAANQTLIDPIYNRFGIRTYFIGDLADTINDFVMDIFGAVTLYILHPIWSRDSHKVEG